MFLEVAFHMLSELQPSEGLTGLEDFPSKVAHSRHYWLVTFGLWKETSVTTLVVLHKDVKCLYNTATDFSQST